MIKQLYDIKNSLFNIQTYMYFIVYFTFLITCNNSYMFPNILHAIYIELKSKFCPYCSLIFFVLLLHVFIKLNTILLQPLHQEFLLSV